ncbi:hypothetical protein MLD63_08770 [Paracoccus sp. TK19116]|uniref:Uncharacterized protein n=1 Tax=Paracoccus albicereus TaxID=2922394 RepID=A0ABT1MQC5_9RHOB|nr:hypothetical protein [Paracoccus albicereus]MCQ0970513.1 hypothetical protein [Paracoccus albicereus]
MPGAVEVLIDTPSALVWSRFQEGVLDGWRYRLFPDGSAVVTQVDDPRGQSFRLSCRPAVECKILSDGSVLNVVVAAGAPRPAAPVSVDGERLATFLAEWVLADSGTPPTRAVGTSQPMPPFKVSERTGNPRQLRTQPASTGRAIDFRVAPSLTFSSPLRCDDADVRCGAAGLVKAAHTADWAHILGLSCNVTASASLQKASSQNVKRLADRLQTSLGCTAQLSNRLSLSVRANSYSSQVRRAAWDPDITYALSFQATERLSLTYASKGIRLDGEGAGLETALDGRLSASLTLPRLPLPAGRGADCRLRVALPDPSRDAVALSCGVALTKRLSLGLSTYLYAHQTQKPWQPDFTYSASWKPTNRLRITYSNYAANRFPWNRDRGGTSTSLRDGTLSFTYDVSF